MKINAAWHKAHRMPANANMEQRIQWHVEHARECGCREVPEKLMDEIKRRKIKMVSRKDE
jgi:hypothetical protein